MNAERQHESRIVVRCAALALAMQAAGCASPPRNRSAFDVAPARVAPEPAVAQRGATLAEAGEGAPAE